MLKELYVENYKSLKKTTVQFKDGLNIIIGKNGSGKSNLLEFINKAIGTDLFFNKPELSNQRFPEYNFSYVFINKDNLGSAIELNVQLPYNNSKNGEAGKTILISQKKENGELVDEKTTFSDGNNHRITNRTQISNVSISAGISEFSSAVIILQRINGLLSMYLGFDIPKDMAWLNIPQALTIDIPFGAVDQSESTTQNLFSYGFQAFLENKLIFNIGETSEENPEGIKEILFTSFQEYKENNRIKKNLESFSLIQDIKISSNVNIYKLSEKILFNNLTFDFKIGGEWVPWSYLSDGTKRLFYLISEIASCNNGVILIEEPELGIHPHQLYKLMEFIKEQSVHKQIIISTHSPLILDTLEADELDRITIAKIENGSSQFHKLTNKEIEKAKLYMHEEMDLSFYWLHSDLEEE